MRVLLSTPMLVCLSADCLQLCKPQSSAAHTLSMSSDVFLLLCMRFVITRDPGAPTAKRKCVLVARSTCAGTNARMRFLTSHAADRWTVRSSVVRIQACLHAMSKCAPGCALATSASRCALHAPQRKPRFCKTLAMLILMLAVAQSCLPRRPRFASKLEAGPPAPCAGLKSTSASADRAQLLGNRLLTGDTECVGLLPVKRRHARRAASQNWQG
jgi:hypothetical protein